MARLKAVITVSVVFEFEKPQAGAWSEAALKAFNQAASIVMPDGSEGTWIEPQVNAIEEVL